MKTILNIAARIVLGAAIALGTAASAIAQAWPSKPVHIIVPYAPGGAGDTLARNVGKKMGEILGQPVLIDNKPGGSGTIGITDGFKAPADGYTITFVAVPYVITQFVYPKLAYDGPEL
jgi:tripartite-type tricarboxylate transporter receptor subunit TctC